MSASRKSHHILREDIINPNIIIIKNIANDFNSPSKKIPCIEKNNIKKITELKNKINIYSKRLVEYLSRTDNSVPSKRIEKLKNQIFELEADLLKTDYIPITETRGKKRKIDYFELELSLTKSNTHKKNPAFQNAVNNAVNTTIKKLVLEKNMKVIRQVMHLDQYSIHEHVLFKLSPRITADEILTGLTISNDGRDGVKLINDTFHSEVKKELQALGVELETQQTKKKYLKLSEYKKQNPLKEKKEAVKAPLAVKKVLATKAPPKEEKTIPDANMSATNTDEELDIYKILEKSKKLLALTLSQKKDKAQTIVPKQQKESSDIFEKIQSEAKRNLEATFLVDKEKEIATTPKIRRDR